MKSVNRTITLIKHSPDYFNKTITLCRQFNKNSWSNEYEFTLLLLTYHQSHLLGATVYFTTFSPCSFFEKLLAIAWVDNYLHLYLYLYEGCWLGGKQIRMLLPHSCWCWPVSTTSSYLFTNYYAAVKCKICSGSKRHTVHQYLCNYAMTDNNYMMCNHDNNKIQWSLGGLLLLMLIACSAACCPYTIRML